MVANPSDPSAGADADGAGAAERFHMIDALRGIAALSVLFFHLYRSAPQSEALQAVFPRFLGVALDYSRSGVAIFFVISGFVIGHTTRHLGSRLKDGLAFSLRRQVRLDPPYYVVLAVVVLLAFAERLVPGLQYRTITVREVVLNMFYLQDITGTPALLAVAWTLCLEVQFYLVVVLLVMLAGRLSADEDTRRGLVRAAALSLGAVSLALPFIGIQAGPWFLGPWWMFCLGLTIAWFMHGRLSRRSTVAILIIVGLWCALLPAVRRDDPWGGPWFGWATGVLIAVLVLTGRLGRRVPRPLLYFGTLSYSLYLVHLPVIDTLLGAMFKVTGPSAAGAVAAYVVGAAVSIAVAHLLQRTVERRSITWSKRFGTTSRKPVPAALPHGVPRS